MCGVRKIVATSSYQLQHNNVVTLKSGDRREQRLVGIMLESNGVEGLDKHRMTKDDDA